MNMSEVFPTLEEARKAPLPPMPPIVTGNEQWQISYRWDHYCFGEFENPPTYDGFAISGYTVHWEDRNKTRSSYMRNFVRKHGERCYYCKRFGTWNQGPDGRLWHRDHVVPKIRGGKGLRGNIVLSCSQCNAMKGTQSEEQFLQRGDRPGPETRTRVREPFAAVLNALRESGGLTVADIVQKTGMDFYDVEDTLGIAVKEYPATRKYPASLPLVYAMQDMFDGHTRWFAR